VVKADINKPIPNEKFALEQPEGTTLQVLGNKPEHQHAAPAEDSSASRKKKSAK